MSSRYDLPGDDAENTRRADALLQSRICNNGPGVAVRVVRHGRILYRGEFGLADITANVPICQETRFLLASVTKQFTAMAIMMLVERGEITYEHRLSEFFEKFPDYAREITVRHLLQHTAGLPEYSDIYQGSDPPTSSTVLDSLSSNYLLFTPGSRYHYSNSGYVVLGQIVECVSGERYPDFLKEHIFKPCDMMSSSVPEGNWPNVLHRAHGYANWDCSFKEANGCRFRLLYGEDGIYATIDDLVRWDQALYTRKLVKQSTLAAAWTDGVPTGEGEMKYGFGWLIEPNYEWHNGQYCGFNTYIARHRSRRLAIIVLANNADQNTTDIGAKLSEIFMPA
jgi:CubicO group peptidase (beta-lactamase class C family)